MSRTLVLQICNVANETVGEREIRLSAAEFDAINTSDTRTTGHVRVLLRYETMVGMLDVPAGWMPPDGR